MNERRVRRLRLPMILAIALFAAILLIGSLAIIFRPVTPRTEYARSGSHMEEDFPDADFENQGKWYGLCSKNSIRSIDDFRKTVSEDTALKTHYAGFNWENARMGSLQNPMLAYVYFRKDDKIFRKEKPIKLPAGDGYITDGNRTLRTYCCNDYTPGPPLSGSADTGASATATTPAQTSTPPAQAQSQSAGSFGSRMVAAAGGWIGSWSDSKSTYPPSNPPPPPVLVPEPGSGLLTVVGIGFFLTIVFVGAYFKQRRAQRGSE